MEVYFKNISLSISFVCCTWRYQLFWFLPNGVFDLFWFHRRIKKSLRHQETDNVFKSYWMKYFKHPKFYESVGSRLKLEDQDWLLESEKNTFLVDSGLQ